MLWHLACELFPVLTRVEHHGEGNTGCGVQLVPLNLPGNVIVFSMTAMGPPGREFQ